mmetsp:Transcript_7608/g.13656  ORF Transcript_7608/g.13656 Transcript_7608/m.13656 type:complete len:146 (+) Transcript_7608:575-1012(+)
MTMSWFKCVASEVCGSVKVTASSSIVLVIDTSTAADKALGSLTVLMGGCAPALSMWNAAFGLNARRNIASEFREATVLLVLTLLLHRSDVSDDCRFGFRLPETQTLSQRSLGICLRHPLLTSVRQTGKSTSLCMMNEINKTGQVT